MSVDHVRYMGGRFLAASSVHSNQQLMTAVATEPAQTNRHHAANTGAAKAVDLERYVKLCKDICTQAS